MKQSIYDNNDFFTNYLEARSKSTSYNVLYEIPCMETTLPDVSGSNVLDIGCGNGHLVYYISSKGAKNVLGIDISLNQIRLARQTYPEYEFRNLDFKQISIEEFSSKGQQYDLIVSSLAFHYVKDYVGLISKIKFWLKQKGCLLFSTEHPMVTCYPQNAESKMEALKKYRNEGAREVEWHGANVIKYHRTIETLINQLVINGFTVEEIYEPCPLPVIIVIKSSLR